MMRLHAEWISHISNLISEFEHLSPLQKFRKIKGHAAISKQFLSLFHHHSQLFLCESFCQFEDELNFSLLYVLKGHKWQLQLLLSMGRHILFHVVHSFWGLIVGHADWINLRTTDKRCTTNLDPLCLKVCASSKNFRLSPFFWSTALICLRE